MLTRTFWMLSCLTTGAKRTSNSWKADVNSFASLDGQLENGPTYAYEYNTRETYGGTITNWGPNDPLNATWWHHVTEGWLGHCLRRGLLIAL